MSRANFSLFATAAFVQKYYAICLNFLNAFVTTSRYTKLVPMEGSRDPTVGAGTPSFSSILLFSFDGKAVRAQKACAALSFLPYLYYDTLRQMYRVLHKNTCEISSKGVKSNCYGTFATGKRRREESILHLRGRLYCYASWLGYRVHHH